MRDLDRQGPRGVKGVSECLDTGYVTAAAMMALMPSGALAFAR